MDEDLGVKVTRNLRRRLSVEAEGTQSPSTPSTPTKKRGTRLAKPALELIDENESVPKKPTRKSVARDAEPAEEKVVTPARRSARVRSNTSLVLEAAPVAESPRAKRAARRTSQLGSDTETATTPARQTRRTRKDSTSSLEKLAISNTVDKAPVQVADVITEEPEKEVKESLSPIRKSPRLNKNRKKSLNEPNTNGNVDTNEDQIDNTYKATESDIQNIKPQIDATTINDEESKGKEADIKHLPNTNDNKNISITSSQLIINIERNPQIASMLNRTVSDLDEPKSDKTNRKRTKSWTTITSKDSTNGNMNSDQINNKETPYIGFGSGDSITLTNEKAINKPSNTSINKSFNEAKSSASDNNENMNHLKLDEKPSAIDTIKFMKMTSSVNVQSTILVEESDSNSDNIPKLTIDLENNCEEQNDVGDQCVPVINQHSPKKSPRKSESFACEPMDIDETIPTNVTINDYSDKTDSSKEDLLDSPKKKLSFSENNKSETNILQSNQNKQRKSSIRISEESSVSSPIKNNNSSKNSNHSKINSFIEQDLNASEIKSPVVNPEDKNNSNVSFNILRKDKSASIHQHIKRKSSLDSQSEISDKINNNANKSKRKSLMSESQIINKSCNENKSTLVLSQIKDISSTTANISKSNGTQVELSKLDTDPIKNKEDKIKNISSTYSTSTPLQQKPLQKLAMQIHSPLIGLNAGSKNNTKENSEMDDDSRDGMIDNEAEDAGDDYESGDSRDETERQYEDENEIVEKGETLESEYFSNDEDYDKDSFIVSSDEEDDELLSGSGDDLSISDNELKMTAKSKEKYNERKAKQQKKASKEMYEARHKLNESQNNSKVNKFNDDAPQPKGKKNRRRIDSSQEDASLDESDDDVIIHKKKKKVKRLSESVSENIGQANENEITMSSKSVLEKNDPLSVAIKLEPKTPQKNFDISTVTINDKIEEVQVDKSLNKSHSSVIKQNETSDPLQATLAQDDDSESDVSENLEIKQNYESILENLNKSNKQQKVKTMDLSLNLNKNTKDNVKNPTLDALNISRGKNLENNEVEMEFIKKLDKPMPEDKKNVSSGDEDSSDSIDMKLLFPEDSNDSEVNASKFQNDNIPLVDPAEAFIPLKKSEAKTNIRGSMELNESRKESKLNTSNSRKSGNNFINTSDKELSIEENAPSYAKKNKKNRKSSQGAKVDTDQTNDISLGFFVDTLGTYGAMDVSTQSNSKKKKRNSHNDSVGNKSYNISVTETQENIPNETSLNVSMKSDKKKKKHSQVYDSLTKSHNISATDHHLVQVTENIPNESLNVSVKSDKKKKKNRQVNNDSVNKSHDTTVTEYQLVETTENIQNKLSMNSSVKSDKKKKKNKNRSLVEETTELNNSEMKKSNKSLDKDTDVIEKSGAEEIPAVVSSDKKKKKKKNMSLETSQIIENIGDGSNDAPLDVSNKSKQSIDLDVAGSLEESRTSSGKKNKENKHNLQPDTDQTTELEVRPKKRKRNLSSHASSDTFEEANLTNPEETSAKKRKQKKMKTNNDNDDDAPTEEKIIYSQDDVTQVEEIPKKKPKKNKKSKKKNIPNETGQEGVTAQHKPKKRKADELDVSHKTSKVSKQNSLDDIHVPRLPQSIVNELDDLPPKNKKQKKVKVKAIATTAFAVEQAKPRKNKPSNYLEESVYLNEDLTVKKKSKSHIKKPKVLPFTPTVITSEHGYTSKFRINVLPEEFEFGAGVTDIPNFKNQRLADRRVKKLGTFERYKQQRGYKLSKF